MITREIVSDQIVRFCDSRKSLLKRRAQINGGRKWSVLYFFSLSLSFSWRLLATVCQKAGKKWRKNVKRVEVGTVDGSNGPWEKEAGTKDPLLTFKGLYVTISLER